ncbi:MAG: hypothetical protein WAM73_15370 [Desulfobacterales bacterium]
MSLNVGKELRQRRTDLAPGKIRRTFFGDDVDIPSPAYQGPHSTNIFAYQTFDTIAPDRVSDLAAHRDAKSQLIRMRPGIQKNKMPVLNFVSGPRQAQKFRPF